MKNLELLFDKNYNTVNNGIFKFVQSRQAFVASFKNIAFDDSYIVKVINGLNFLYQRYKRNIPLIIIELDDVFFTDKLVYIILECIVYYYWVEKLLNIKLYIKVKSNIFIDGFNRYSPLKNCKNREEYKNKFLFDISHKHYRKMVEHTGKNDNSISKIFVDIKNYMKNNDVSKSNIDELSNVLIELIGNGCEHSKTDILVDIDITDSTYAKNNNIEDNYYGLNVALIGFSNIPFYALLKDKLINNHNNYGKKYDDVLCAYNNHKIFFGDEYDEKDFFSIASFQDKVSGSIEKDKEAGGRGLTALLKSIEERSDTHYCYLLSEDRIIALRRDFLNKRDEYVGFNESGDFINERPDKDIFHKCKTIIPGIAYNLNFVLKED